MRIPRTALATITITTLTACSLPSTAGDTTPTNELLADITIASEDTSYDYDRDDWPHWSSAGDGCDTRDIVLQQQGTSVKVSDNCDITGKWKSPYDNETVTNPSDLDIDHVVPLGEAARSGVLDWTEADRERYANDERFLLAVTASSNRSKSDDDPASWMPTDTTYHCEYLELWVEAKHTYNLTMDSAEHDAVTSGLNRC